jgi:hypothetical protein
VSPEVQSQPREDRTVNSSLGKQLLPEALEKVRRWISALKVRKFPFLEVSPNRTEITLKLRSAIEPVMLARATHDYLINFKQFVEQKTQC